MSDIHELYEQLILDHNRNPKNFQKPDRYDRELEGYNPLCGDRYTLYLHMENDCISRVCFQGEGCAISKAAASIMTTLVKGKTVDEVEKMFKIFHKLVTEGPHEGTDIDSLGKIAVFAGVYEYPARVKCASLSWHTLISILKGEETAVSTE